MNSPASPRQSSRHSGVKSLLIFLLVVSVFIVSVFVLLRLILNLANVAKKDNVSEALSVPLDTVEQVKGLASVFDVNIEGNFNKPTNFKDATQFDKQTQLLGGLVTQNADADFGTGNITAGNVVYRINAGTGILVSGGQNPTISLAQQIPTIPVLSVQGKTGAIKFTPGNGITIKGLEIANDDPGSAQSIFKNIAVGGQNTIISDNNDDTLTFVPGAGIAITTDSTGKSITITNSNFSTNVSGWTRTGTNVALTNQGDFVGIGTSAPQFALDIAGDLHVGNVSNLHLGNVTLNSVGTNNTNSGSALVGIYDEFNYSNGTTVQAVLNDFDNEISNLYAISGTTYPGHAMVSLTTNGYSYLSLVGATQALTMSAVSLTSDVSGVLSAANGGTGLNSATAPAGTLLIGSGTGFTLRSVSGDAAVASDGTLTLANSGVTAGTFGTATGIPVITVDAKGRVTSATTAPLSNIIFSTGSQNYLARFASDNTLVTGIAYDNGTNFGIGTTSPAYKLDVNGDIRLATGSTLFIGAVALNASGTNNTTSGASRLGSYDEYDYSNSGTVQSVLKDFDTHLGILYAAVGGTAPSHTPVTLTTNGYSYLSLATVSQTLTMSAVSLTSDVSGVLNVSNGGTGLNTATAPNGSLLIGNGSGFSLSTLSGDATLVSNGALTLAGSGVAAGTYGSGTGIPVLTVDAKGRVTLASTAALNLTFENPLTISNGLSRVGNTVTVDGSTTGTTSTTASNSGLEVSADGVRILGGCGNNEVLAWNSGNSTWYCATVSGVGALAGSGTPNYLARFTGATSLASGSIYDTGTNVGIGTTNPVRLLTVAASSSNQYTAQLNTLGGYNLVLIGNGTVSTVVGVGSDTLGTIGTTTNHGFTVTTNALERIRIDTAGNVGIGTTTPTYLLDVNGDLRIATGSNLILGTVSLGGAGTSNVTSGSSKVGTFDEFTYSNNTTVQAVLKDFDTQISSLYSAIGSTSPAHSPVSLTTNSYGYLSLNALTQALTMSAVSLTTDVSGVLTAANGGTGINSATAPVGALLIGNGSGFSLSTLGGDATVASTGTLTLANSGVGAGTYGSGTGIPVLVVDAKGRVTSASTAALNLTFENPLTISNGLSRVGNTVTVDGTTTGTTSTTASNSGLEVSADGVRMLGGCANNEVLAWNSGNNTWYCATVTGVGALSGNGTPNYLARFSGASAITSSVIYDNGTNVGIGTTNPQFKLDTNGDIRIAGGSDLILGTVSLGSAGTSNVTSGSSKVGTYDEFTYSNSATVQGVLNDLDNEITTVYNAISGGTHPATSLTTNGYNFLSLNASTQALTLSAVSLTSDVSGVLTAANGGTGINSSTAPTGSLLIGNGSGFSLNILNGDATVASNGTLSLANSGVTSGTYGSALSIPLVTVDAKGRVTSVSTSPTNFESPLVFSNGLSRTVNTITVDTTTTGVTSTTASNSGLETTSEGVRLVGGCGNDEVLSWDSTLSTWKCSSKLGGGAVTGSGNSGQLSFWTGASTLSGTSNLFWDSGNGRLGLSTTAPAYTLDVNGNARIGSGYDLYLGSIALGGAGTSNTTSGAYKVGSYDEFNYSDASTVQGVLKDLDTQIGTLYSAVGGTAPSHSPVSLTTNGYSYLSLAVVSQTLTMSAVSLTSDVSGVLTVANGGTGINSATAPAGSLLIGNGSGYTLSTLSGDATVASNGTLTLANSGVGAGTYGSTTGIPVITVDAKGRVTSSSTAALTNVVYGTGSTNYLARFSNNNTLTTGTVYDTGTLVGVGTTAPAYKLDVNGDIHLASGSDLIFGNVILSGTGASNVTSGSSKVGVFDELSYSNAATVQAVLKDFDTQIGSLYSAVGGTAPSHAPVTLTTNGYSYLSFAQVSQTLTMSAVSLTSDVSGVLTTANGGTGINSGTAPAGSILIGNGSGFSLSTLSGDATVASDGTLSLATSGVSSGTYGSVLGIPVIVVDAKGRITSASTAALNLTFENPLTISNGLNRVGNTVTVDGSTNGTTSTTASNSGLEVSADGVRMLGGCANNEVLAWNSGNNTWYCAAVTGVGALAGSGTPNYLARFSGTSSLTTGTIYDNGTNVGIGTTNPADVFQVASGGTNILRAGTTQVVLFDTSTGLDLADGYIRDINGSFTLASEDNLYIYADALANDSSSNIIFGKDSYTAGSGTEFARFSDIGNFGIGTTAPTQLLDVAGQIAVNGKSVLHETGGTLYFGEGINNYNFTSNGGNFLFGSTTAGFGGMQGQLTLRNDSGGASLIFSGSTTAYKWQTTNQTDLTLSTGDNFYQQNINERLRINNAGYLGLGTTAPAYRLDVNGDMRIASGADLILGSVLLGGTGASNVTSGSSKVGVYDELTYSNSATVQAVLKDFDTQLGTLYSAVGGTAPSHAPVSLTTNGYSYLSLAQVSQTLTMSAVSLTSDVSGILTTTNGGTGLNSGTAPTGSLLIGNGSGFSLSTLSGDATVATNGALTLATSGVGAGTYGSTTGIPVLTVDAKGRVTSASTAALNLTFESPLTFSNGLSRATNTITVDATTSGTTSTTAANSGIEVTSDGVRLVGGCGNDEVLAWDSTLSTWKCSSKLGGGAVTGSGNTGQVSFWTGASTLSGTSNLFWDSGSGRLGLGTTAPAYLFDANGSVRIAAGYDLYLGAIALGGAGTSDTTSGAYKVGAFDEFTYSSASTVQAVLKDFDTQIGTLYSAVGGTAPSHSPVSLTTNGYSYLSLATVSQTLTMSAVSLTSDVSGILTTTNGGTGLNTATAPEGSLLIGNGSGFSLSTLSGDASVASNGTLTLANSGVGAGTYGSATGVPVITVDAKGRITSSSTAALTNVVYGTGSTNYLARFSNNNTVIAGTIYDDGTNIGIGTTNPANTLDIRHVTNATASSPSTYAFRLYQGSGGYMTFGADGVTQYIQSWNGRPLYINGQGNNVILNATSGNVGIGNTNPQYVLDVNGDIRIASGSNLYLGTVSLGGAGTNNTTSGSSKVGAYDEFTYSNAATVQAVLKDFDTQIGTLYSAVGGTAPSHSPVSLTTNSYSYLSLNAVTQALTMSAVSLTTDVSGVLTAANGGTGINAGTAPTGSLLIGNGSGYTLSTLSGDATVASNGTLSLANSGVGAGTYGSGTGIPVLVVDAKGRITGASTAALNLTFENPLTFSNGLSRATNTITVDGSTTGTTSTTASNSGLEVSADGVRMLGGCSNNQVLAWNSGNNTWYCAAVTGVGALSGSGTPNFLARFSGASSLTSSTIYDNGTYVGIGSSSPTYKLEIADDGGSSSNLAIKRLNSNQRMLFDFSSAVPNIKTTGSNGINFLTSDTTQTLRVSEGKVSIGTSAISPSSASLWVYGGVVIGDTIYRDTTVSSYGLLVQDNVGIGTTNPMSKLHVNGGVGSLATGLSFGDGDTGIAETSDDTLDIYSGSIQSWETNSNIFRAYLSYGPALRRVAATGVIPTIIPRYPDTDTGLGSAEAGVLSLIAGGTNVLNLNASGYVGIGTSSPLYSLDVNGDIRIASGSDLRLGSILLGGTGASNVTSGSSKVGVFDELSYSNAATVQAVLKDFDTQIGVLYSAVGGTAPSHSPVSLTTNGYSYLSLATVSQTLTMSAVSLTSDVTGVLTATNGGTGLNSGTAPAGSLLIGNGSGFSLSTLSGDASVASNGTLSLANSGVGSGTYGSTLGIPVIVVDAKGRVTSASTAALNLTFENPLTISNGLSRVGNTVTVDGTTTGTTSTTASNSGLEVSADGVRMLGGCANNQVLAWNSGNNTWYCAAVTGVGAISGSGTPNYLARFSGASSLTDGTIYDSGTSVGIGTTQPTSMFHISSSAPSVSYLTITNTNSFASKLEYIGSTNANPGDSGELKISAGILGHARLTLWGNGDAEDTAVMFTNGGTNWKLGSVIPSAATYTWGLNRGSTNVFLVNSSDYFGIGTTAPAYKLDVNGDIRIASGSDLRLGTVLLGGTGASNVTSGSSKVGAFDEFTYSNAATVQAVLKDFDTQLGTLYSAVGGTAPSHSPVSLTANGYSYLSLNALSQALTLSAVSLTTDISGVLSASNGGTGLNSGTAPIGSLLIGNGSGFSLSTLSGDATVASNGTLTLANSGVGAGTYGSTLGIPVLVVDAKGRITGVSTAALNLTFENPLTFSNGLSRATNTITVDGTTTGTTSTTASNSGLEVSSDGVRMLGGCSNNQVLAWNSGNNTWYCAAVTGVGAISGSGTPNYLARFNGTSDLTSSVIYDNGTNIGIGTTNPSGAVAVDIVGSLRTSSYSYFGGGLIAGFTREKALYYSSSNNGYLGFPSDGNIAMMGANVGIGTTGPDYKLTISQSAASNGIRINGAGAQSGSSGYLDIDSSGYFRVAASSVGALYANTTALAYWTTNGIEMEDNIRLDFGNNNDYKILYDAGVDNRLELGDGTNDFITVKDLGTAADINFNTNGLYIQSTGRVGIGTTAPWATLDVRGALRLGSSAIQGNILDTTPGSSAPGNSLYWGSRTLLDTVNFGNYGVLNISTANTGLILSGSTGALNISLDATTSGVTSTTASNSGLEIATDGVRLLGGCSANQILSWDAGANRWVCSSPAVGSLSGNGVANRLAFWNGTNSLASSQDLYWDNTNNYLGIGTSTPGYMLDLYNASNAQLRLKTDTTGGTAALYLDGSPSQGGASNVTFLDSGVTKASIELSAIYLGLDIYSETGGLINIQNTLYATTGNRIGIGTTAPTTRLDIVGTSTEATYGTNKLTNGDFATGDFSSWTAGANWAVTSNAALHTAGSTAPLSQNISVNAGTVYQIEWTDSGVNGWLTFSIGSNISRAYSAWESANAKRATIVASGTGTQTFSIYPSSNYDGAVDNVTVRAVNTNASVVETIRNSDGSLGVEFRAGGTGLNNTAIGIYALNINTTGFSNVAYGNNSLANNTTGYDNTSIGYDALTTNTGGIVNSAFGVGALANNTIGSYNNAFGESSLYNNTTGTDNIGIGVQSLFSNTTGRYNVALGTQTLSNLSSGFGNVAVGLGSGGSITTGTYNTFLGHNAGVKLDTSSSNNVILGNYAGPTSNIVLNDKLFIDSTQNDSPLIWGDFATDILGVNGSLGVGTTAPAYSLEVAKDADVYLSVHALTGNNQTAGIILQRGGILDGLYGDWTVKNSFGNLYFNSTGSAGDALLINGDTGLTNLTANATIGYPLGTTAPTSGLLVAGRVGIGTSTPTEQVEIAGGNLRVWNDNEVGADVVSGWINSATNPYETLNLSGTDITSGINTTGYGMVYSNGFSGVAGNLYKVVFNITLNSGTMPAFRVGQSTTLTNYAYTATPSSGANTLYVFIADTTTHYAGFYNASGVASNFSVSGFSMKPVVGGNLAVSGLYTGGGSKGLKIDNYGNVGIGTTNPQMDLHISSTADASIYLEADTNNTGGNDTAYIKMTQNAGTHGIVMGISGAPDYDPAGNAATGARYDSLYFGSINGSSRPVQFAPDGVVRMTLDSDGTLGLGTTNPAHGDIELMQAVKPTISIVDTTFGTGYMDDWIGALDFYTSDTSGNFLDVGQTLGAAIRANVENDQGNAIGLGFWVNNNLTSASEMMRLSSSGFLGLGTTSPVAPLDIKQTAQAGTAEELMHLSVSDDNSAYISFRNNSVSDNLFLPLLRFKGAGSNVAGNIQAVIQTDAGNNPAWVFTGQLASSALATRPLLSIRNYTTDLMFMNANGYTGFGTTAPLATLDVRGGLHLGSSAAAGNMLDLSPSASSPTSSLYWGSRTLLDNVNFGNFGVLNISTANTGLILSGSTGSVNISLDVTTSGVTSNTASNSGLEIASDGVRLLGGCAAGQVLAWDAGMSKWICSYGPVQGTGVSGRIAFWDGASSLASSQDFYWDNGNKFFGIGTSNPSAIMDFVRNGDAIIELTASTGSGQAAGFKLQRGGTSDGFTDYNLVDLSGNFVIDQSANGSAATKFMLQDTTGNVGIGSVNPLSKLSVLGNASIGFNYASSAPAPTNGLLVEGSVGIGTTNPTSKLTVAGSANFLNNAIIGADSVQISDPGANEGFYFTNTTAGWYFDVSPLDRSNADGNLNLYGTANNIALWRPSLWVFDASNYATATALSNGGLNFTTTGTGSISFNPGGNVGVGTTAPDTKLHLVGGDLYAADDSGYTFNNASSLSDIFAQGNLEVDGTIYGTTAALGQINIAGDLIGDFTGQGLITSGTAVTIDAITTGTTSTTASNSGLEVTSDGVRLLGGCANNQMLVWDGGANRWQCTTAATGIAGNGVAGRLTFWSTASALASDQDMYWDFTNKRLGIGTSTPSNTVDIVQSATTGATLNVTRNLAAASTDTSVVKITNANTGDDQPALKVTNSGSSYGIYLVQTGPDNGLFVSSTLNSAVSSSLVKFEATNPGFDVNVLSINNAGTGAGAYLNQGTTGLGSALSLYSNVDSSVIDPLVNILIDNPNFDQYGMQITNYGSNTGLFVNQKGVAAGLNVYSNVGSTASSSLVYFNANNTAFDQTVFTLTNRGTGNGMYLNNYGSGVGLAIAQDGPGYGLTVYSNVNATATSALVDLTADNVAFDQPVLSMTNHGTNSGVYMYNSGTGNGIDVYQTVASTGNALNIDQAGVGRGLSIWGTSTAPASPLVYLGVSNTSFNQDMLSLDVSGSGTGINISMGTTGTANGLYVSSGVNASATNSLVDLRATNSAFDQYVLNAQNTGSYTVASFSSAGTGSLARFASTGAVTTPTGISVLATNGSGVITDAIDVTDPEIVNALSVGANTIVGTTGNITFDKFSMTGSTGYVSIGITNVSSPLVVYGTDAAGYTASFSRPGATGVYIGGGSNGGMLHASEMGLWEDGGDTALAVYDPTNQRYFYGGNSALAVTNTGLVGLGTSVPATNLHISSSTDAAIYLQADTDNAGSSDNPYIKMTQDGGTYGAILGLTGATGYNPEGTATTGARNDALFWGSIAGASRPIQFSPDGTVRVTIGSTGLLGVGSTNPTHGNIDVWDSNKPNIAFVDPSNGANNLDDYIGAVEFYSNDTTGNYADAGQTLAAALRAPIESQFGNAIGLGFWVNNNLTSATEAMRLSSDGNLGIGTTSPTAKLTLFGAGNDIDQIRMSSTGGATSEYGFFGSDAANNSMRLGYWDGSSLGKLILDSKVGIGTTAPTEPLTIAGLNSTSGTALVVDANGNVFKSSSSLRYKENVKDLNTDFSKVLDLRSVAYNYKDTGAFSVGFIAEEAAALNLPGIVLYDNEGRPESIRYDLLTVYLKEVVKDQQVSLTGLSSNIDDLTNKVAALEAYLGTTNESTQSSQTSESSSANQSPSAILAQIETMFTQIQDLISGLGLSNEGGALTVKTDMNVLGDTTLNNVTVTGDLTTGTVQISSINSSIDILGASCYNPSTETKNMTLCEDQSLYLQKSLAGNVNMFDGRVVIEPDGTATFLGTVKAKAVEANTVKTDSLVIQDASPIIGGGVIKAGTTSVIVNTSSIKSNSRIFVSATSSSNGQNLVSSEKVEGVSFKVSIDAPVSTDVTFDWWVINTQ